MLYKGIERKSKCEEFIIILQNLKACHFCKFIQITILLARNNNINVKNTKNIVETLIKACLCL